MLSETRPSKVGTWTDSALRVLRERYLLRNQQGEVVETPEEMCWRVAQSIAAGEARYGRSPAAVHEVATAFYETMVDGYFVPNSPTLMNAGKGNGLQYSACYVLPVGDSMEEIFDSVKEAAIIHKSGGGTGFAFSRLRPEGRHRRLHPGSGLGSRVVPARLQQRHGSREAGRHAARRQHGHPPGRSPRHPRVHRLQARRRDHQLQHLGGRDRLLHGRAGQGRGLRPDQPAQRRGHAAAQRP